MVEADSTFGCAVLWPYVLIPGYLQAVSYCKSNRQGNCSVTLCMHGHSLSTTEWRKGEGGGLEKTKELKLD